MAKRRKYGQTWWGAAWLSALRDVPDENRLARGRSYYANGHVFNIEFSTQTMRLQALVSGSAYTPYEVSFTFTPLTEDERSRLLAAVSEDQQLVAEILDGSLPERLLEICKREKIELFPKSWRDLHPHCTCPDSSAFCKHLAALFYTLLDAIDENPFAVFLTRGLSLQKELSKKGIDLSASAHESPRHPAELVAASAAFCRAPQAATVVKDKKDDEEARAAREQAALERLRSVDCTGLPDMSSVLESLLPERLRPAAPKGENTRILGFLRQADCNLASLTAFESHELEETAEGTANAALSSLLRATNAPAKLPDNARVVPVLQVSPGGTPGLFLTVSYKKPRARKLTQETFYEAVPGALACEALTLSALELERMPAEIECLATLARAARAMLFARTITPIVVTEFSIEDPFCPRLWWTPMMREPHTAALVSALAEAVAPWAEALIDPYALEDLKLDSSDERFSQKCVFLLLTAIINGFIAGASQKTVMRMVENDPGLFQALIETGADVPDFDGRTPESFTQTLTRYFRAYLLADTYPWRPVLTARVHADGVKLNFGILAREETEDDESDESAQDGATPEGKPLYDLRRPVMLQKLLKDEAYASDRFAALNVIKTLAEACPVLTRIASARGKPVTLESGELKDFLFESAPVLMVLGVTVMLPQSLKRILTPRLVASISQTSGPQKSFLDKDAVTRFDWHAALGDKTLTPEELDALAAHAGEIVRFGEDFVYLDSEALAHLTDAVRRQPQPTYLEKMRALLTGEYEGAEVIASDDVRERLKTLTEVTGIAPPVGLKARLRPYQARGYAWLMKNLTLGIGALIADDMGLGKTLQVIAAITALKEKGELDAKKGKALAVVPTTLLTNWMREIARFSPGLTVGLYHGAGRSLAEREEMPDVTLTTYGTLRRDAEILGTRRWRLLVLDEAQAVKNASTNQSVAVRSIHAPQVIAMTGTPVENRLMEYWSILEIVQPRLLGSADDFARTFAAPIEYERDAHAIEAFRRLTAPFMLRRLKSDKSIIADLPEKNSIDLFTTLTPAQAALYQKTLESLMSKIETIDGKMREAQDAAERNTLRTTRRGALLALITGLKQICNSPSQYLKTETPAPDSGKGAALLETLERCHEAGRKVLIFTQYREMGERLQRWIANATGESVDFLHGGVPLTKRQDMVDRFQNDRAVRTMIISLKAGGTGLNLTAASAVIHYDLWWNPAVEAQATDRAYRIGQRRDVLVYRFVTAGTFEERVNDMLASKRELADLTVAAGETWIGELPGDELKALFALGGSAGGAVGRG